MAEPDPPDPSRPDQPGPSPDPSDEARMAFVLQIRERGVRDQRVVRAIESVPRAPFVDPSLVGLAHADQALPIACGQTISQPSLVGLMTQALAPGPADRVLEIGTGSGWQTAILARLAARVFTLDRYRTLVDGARRRWQDLGLDNITAAVGDGTLGWSEHAPFDRIMVTAAGAELAEALVEQLGPGGRLVAPVGEADATQRLLLVERTSAGLTRSDLGAVRFVPLVPGIAKHF